MDNDTQHAIRNHGITKEEAETSLDSFKRKIKEILIKK